MSNQQQQGGGASGGQQQLGGGGGGPTSGPISGGPGSISGGSGMRLVEEKPSASSPLKEPLLQPQSSSALGGGGQQQGGMQSLGSPSSVSPASSSSMMTGGGSIGNQRGVDSLLMFFARCPVEQNYPRPTVGTMHMFKGGPALTVQSEEHVTRVFAKLVTEGFLSAPVLDEHRRFAGFVDMLDIVTFTVRLFEKEQLDWNQLNWEGFWGRLATFREARVKEVMGYWMTDNRRGQGIRKGFSLLHAMEVMAREGVHRVAVIDDNDQVCGISTQSMIISLMSQHINNLGVDKDSLVKNMFPTTSEELLTINETQRAIEAFKLMSEKRVTGLAVVNARGALVDVISVRDLRCMGTDGAKWWRLFETVHTFKMLSRVQYPHQTPRRPLYVTENDTFQRVVELMDDGNIHRVIQVAEMPNEQSSSGSPVGIGGSSYLGGDSSVSYRPVRVLSQRDVIRFFMKLFGMPEGDDRYSMLRVNADNTNVNMNTIQNKNIGGGSGGDINKGPTTTSGGGLKTGQTQSQEAPNIQIR